jgi:TRAP-type C4-dicarboxylate transport system permease small subunit
MKKLILISLALCLVFTPTLALAQITGGLKVVTHFAGTASGTDETAILEAIRNVVNALLTLVGVIAVIFVIIGGVRYITSQGDESAAAQAKLTVVYAFLGLVVIILSAVIVNLVIAPYGAG